MPKHPRFQTELEPLIPFAVSTKTYSDLFGIVSRNHVVVVSLPKTDLAHKKKP